MKVWIWLIWWFGVAGASCPTPQLMENFNVNQFMGSWYMIQAQDSIFLKIKSCHSAVYKLQGSEIQVISKGLDSTGAPKTSEFTLKIVDPNVPAHMVTDFVTGVEPPFDIVDTDYETFSCAHSCVSIMGMKTEFAFIFSRNRVLDDKNVKHCRTIFESYGIDLTGLEPTPQKDCHDHSDL